MTLAIDTDDTSGCLMFCRDKNGLATDSVHVDACAGLQVIQVHETELCDEVDDAVFLADLHGHGEVATGLWGEVNVNCLLGINRVALCVIDLNNVELSEKKRKEKGCNLARRFNHPIANII